MAADAAEAALEAPLQTRPSAELGRAARVNDVEGRYLEFCKNTTPDRFHLRGLKLVVDCAHGATYHLAPALFEELGATVETLGVNPDGLNINEGCGATAPAALRARVLETGADLGLAFDGDGDRLIMVDRTGTVRDGDSLLYVLAQHQLREGTLRVQESVENMRDAPNGRKVGTLLEGTEIEEISRDGKWVRFRFEGWIWGPSLEGFVEERPREEAAAAECRSRAEG